MSAPLPALVHAGEWRIARAGVPAAHVPLDTCRGPGPLCYECPPPEGWRHVQFLQPPPMPSTDDDPEETE